MTNLLCLTNHMHMMDFLCGLKTNQKLVEPRIYKFQLKPLCLDFNFYERHVLKEKI